MMQIRETKKSCRGFTLVEVIVVCVILALLAAVAVPSFAGYIDKKKADECRVNRKSLLLMYSAEQVKKPSVTIADVLQSTEGKAVRCPSGGTYTSEGDKLACSIPGHGEEIVTAENTPADKVPGREEPPSVITPTPTAELSPTGAPTVSASPTNTSAPTVTGSPTVSPTVTAVPTDTPAPKPTDTEIPEPSIKPDDDEEDELEDELEDMAGDWEDYVEWVVEYKKTHWRVEGVARGTIFEEEKGDKTKYGVYVGGGNLNTDAITNKQKPMESMRDILIVDISKIYRKDEFEANRRTFKTGDLYYDGKDFYVYSGTNANQNSPAPTVTGSYYWVKILEFDDAILDRK